MNLSEIVTVVIPTIEERSDLLREALESLQRQSVGSPAVLVGVDEAREGPAVVRNRLVEQVTTPFVLFLDDDDYLHDDYFETVLPFIYDHDVTYTWCVKEGWAASYLNHPWIPDLMYQENQLPVTVVINTESFRNAGGFKPTDIYEDWGLWLRLMDSGASFKCIEEFKWTYRRHGGSRTHANQVRVASGEAATG